MNWDDDIAALKLSDTEKDGLQVYRNYERAFRTEACKRFAAEVDAEGERFERANRVLNLLTVEEARVMPMIVCAYADEVLSEMFERAVPEGVPGGRASLFSGFGPMGSLANRIKIGFAFGFVDASLLSDVDRVRSVRNRVAHDWDHARLAEFYVRSPINDMGPIEGYIAWDDPSKREVESLGALPRFRVRLLWTVARLTYEAAYRWRAIQRRLEPYEALYGPNRPKALGFLGRYAKNYTQIILANVKQ